MGSLPADTCKTVRQKYYESEGWVTLSDKHRYPVWAQTKAGCCKGWGWVGAQRVAWLFKYPQSGSKGHLSQALTFPDSISLLCCCTVPFVGPAKKEPWVRLCVNVCRQIFIEQYPKNEKKCVYSHNCMRTQWAHFFGNTIILSVRPSISLLIVHAFVCVCTCMQAATSFTLGILNVGHKALKTPLRSVWTTPPQPPLHLLAVWQSAAKVYPLEIKFSVPFSIIQQLDWAQPFLSTGNHVNMGRRLFVLHPFFSLLQWFQSHCQFKES